MNLHTTRVHNKEIFFKCTICDTPMFTKILLNIHMLGHTGKKQHKCTHCPKQYIQISNRNTHIRLTHSGLPNRCDQCNKSFVDLKTHKLTLHCEKKIKCSMCEKLFSLPSTMQKHVRHVHEALSNNFSTLQVEEEEGELGDNLEEGEIYSWIWVFFKKYLITIYLCNLFYLFFISSIYLWFAFNTGNNFF